MSGSISWGCATNSLGREWCGQPAEYFAFGMARCGLHAVELSPCTWEPNQTPDGVCAINHRRWPNPVLCRNTRKELTR